MKKYLVVTLMILPLIVSCGTFFKKTITVREAVIAKDAMDRTENPASRFLMLNDLSEKHVSVKNTIVKDVVASGNIDYDFCVIVRVPYEKGAIDCYIYSRDVKTISKLVKNKSKIDASGDFGRFFTLLDDAYTKLDILNARITILEAR